MLLTHVQLRKKFVEFWKSNGHKEIPPIPLIPQNDPTTLFTGSGMQQLVPYLLGEPHPQGKRVFDIQPCFRSQDIDEVGDNRHTTFFEMMGNWSLGDYFKKEQLAWFLKFLTEEVGLPEEKLYVTVFDGDENYKVYKNKLYQPLTPDLESIAIWGELFKKKGYKKGIDGFDPNIKIYTYESDKNWWSRAGTPQNMPIGEIGGPDSEIFYDFGENLKFHENSIYKNKICHLNCDCGRFMEIGNSVFMQYKKITSDTLEELPKKNVDFGGGLERILAAANDDPDVFKTDLFIPIINSLEKITDKKYSERSKSFRIIADHIKAATFLRVNGVIPNSKDRHGSFLRRILDKVAEECRLIEVDTKKLSILIDDIINIYSVIYPFLKDEKQVIINDIVNVGEKIKVIISSPPSNVIKEIPKLINEQEAKRILRENTNRFQTKFEEIILNSPLSSLASVAAGTIAFDAKSSNGYPINETKNYAQKTLGELFIEKKFNEGYELLNSHHKQLSKKEGQNIFKGGLADQSEQTIKYHTATHLLHQALFDTLGDSIRQEGSNITGERLRFDFYSIVKPTKEQIEEVEKIINEKIQEKLPVEFKILPKNDAIKLGAKSFFREKYPDMVKVYFIKDYSTEFCGGPHVKNTLEIKKIKIFKFEKIGSNLYRIYAK